MKKLDSIKAVIFDLGDTLSTYTMNYDEREKRISEEVHKSFSKMGYSISEKFYYELKSDMWNDWKEQFGVSESEFDICDFLQNLLDKLGVKDRDIKELTPLIIEIIYNYDLKYVMLKYSVKETLKKLQNMSFRMGIISNSSYSYDHILNILKQLEIDDYFNAVLVSSKEKICKPNLDIFKKALKLLGISSKEAVFIGNDPQVDIEGAKRAGIRSILIVNSGEKRVKTKQTETEVIVVKNLIDILKYLEK